MNDVAAIILSAGKGTRMKSTTINKVMLPLQGKPIVSHTVDHMRKAHIKTIVMVVGFAKESISSYFRNRVSYAVQNDQLGTAHALECGLDFVPKTCKTIISVYGDDSYIYSQDLYKKMVRTHMAKNADITIYTIDMNDPVGLGRIIRGKNGSIEAIVEEKDATEDQKKIHEVNTGFYVFKRSFVEKHINRIKNNNASKEYYLTDIIDLAVGERAVIANVHEPNALWRGVNRPEELLSAEKLIS